MEFVIIVMVTYRGSRYNLPVDILVLSGYPFTPPSVFVRPTPDMMIRDRYCNHLPLSSSTQSRRHQHVDANGVVFLSYLSDWDDQHTLADLVRSPRCLLLIYW